MRGVSEEVDRILPKCVFLPSDRHGAGRLGSEECLGLLELKLHVLGVVAVNFDAPRDLEHLAEFREPPEREGETDILIAAHLIRRALRVRHRGRSLQEHGDVLPRQCRRY